MVCFLVAECDEDTIKWALGEEQTDEEYPSYAFMIDGIWSGINLIPK